MKYITLPDQGIPRNLSFYLALEEYAARRIDEGDLFFMWQVQPTVIFGRNQSIEAEVNLDYCHQHGIKVFRRKSGGGCVYADMGNVMLSLVSRHSQASLAFNQFIGMVVLVLRKLGIEAVYTTHNDILVGGRKVSGTACYQLPEGNIVHGTLLYDTNMEHMVNAITPGPEKLQSKGIQSVRQRIGLLKEHTTLTVGQLMDFIRQTLCEGEYQLTDTDVTAIEEMEEKDYVQL